MSCALSSPVQHKAVWFFQFIQVFYTNKKQVFFLILKLWHHGIVNYCTSSSPENSLYIFYLIFWFPDFSSPGVEPAFVVSGGPNSETFLSDV